MEIYRIRSERYSKKLSASGRANRWNFENRYVVHASSTRSLATLELIAHRNAIMDGTIYKVIVIGIPDEIGIIESVDLKKLGSNWNLLENRSVTQNYGDQWYKHKKSVALKVPSAIIVQEHNFVLNTTHPDFYKIKIKQIENFVWDKSLH